MRRPLVWQPGLLPETDAVRSRRHTYCFSFFPYQVPKGENTLQVSADFSSTLYMILHDTYTYIHVIFVFLSALHLAVARVFKVLLVYPREVLHL